MAFFSKNVTMTTARLSLDAGAHTPVKWVRLENPTGNADVKVGDKTITSTAYGFIVEDGPAVSKDIGPFGGGECPFNLEDVYVLGTDGQTLHVSYMTL